MDYIISYVINEKTHPDTRQAHAPLKESEGPPQFELPCTNEEDDTYARDRFCYCLSNDSEQSMEPIEMRRWLTCSINQQIAQWHTNWERC